MRLSYAELVSENPLEFFENRFANEKLVLREHEFQDVMTEPASREGRDQDIGVHDLPGFSIRVYPSGAKVYVVQTRVFGRSKHVTVGRHGKLSADQARKEATRIIARIKAGESAPLAEPSAAPTVADLAERYQREYVAMHCKPLTVSHYGLMLRKHIVPAMGKLLVSEVERKHIMAFQYGLRDMPTVANRAVEILVKMFNLADAWGWRPSGRNPCRFVRRYKVEKHHERFLTPEELYRLGRVLDAAPAERLASTHAAAAIRLLVLTGCRRNEVLGLRWEDLDFEAGEMRLADSKTGARVVPLPRRRRGCWRASHGFRAIRGCFRGGKRATAGTTSTTPGTACASGPVSTACAFMTCDTPSLRGHWRSGRACR